MKYRSTKIKKSAGTPLAIIGVNRHVWMLSRLDKKTTSSLVLSRSLNGLDFDLVSSRISLKTLSLKKEKLKICHGFSVSRTPNGFVMTYIRDGVLKRPSGSEGSTEASRPNVKKSMLIIARSSNLYEWKVLAEFPADDTKRGTVVYDKAKDKFELYRDGLFIKNQSATTLSVWREKPTLLFTSRNGQFDSEKLSIIGSTITTDGILLVYDASVEHHSKTLLQVGGIIFDINNPRQVIWRGGMPIWQAIIEGSDKTRPITSLGFAHLRNSFLLYWFSADGGVIVAKIPALFKEIEESRHYPKIFERHKDNPIIEPVEHSNWEGEGTFNPAVVLDDEGTIHLLYRAVGPDGISRIGYARSKDGTYFNKRSPYPVFEPSRGYGMPDPKKEMGPKVYNPYIYTSGGGWGGAEDPRTVIIDDTVYMLYTAFEGWGSMRMALTSISLEDFKAGRWHWRKPRLISSPENRSKNWLLFPEKIHGKYAILHSISPKVLIKYIDDIDTFDEVIYSPRPEGPQPGRKKAWDNLLKGSGPPPVKTDLGWLLLYHALQNSDTGKYRLGAMILDLDDPTKILYRSKHPILSPDMDYENEGKPGIVYASGAVIRGDDLYIYYGGGDRVVCVAQTPIKEFLKYLVTGNAASYQLKKV